MLAFTFVLLVSPPRIVLADHGHDDPQMEHKFQPGAEQMIIDGLVYRPLSLAGTLIGTGIFIVTLPFSLIGNNVDQAGQELVVKPARYTFERCLGCLQPYR